MGRDFAVVIRLSLSQWTNQILLLKNFQMITVEEAFAAVEANVMPLAAETIRLADATGRVLAADVRSDVDSPPHNKSVMDGFAVKAADVAAGVKAFRVLETIIAGAMPTQKVTPGTTSRIMTGAPLPEGADSVVMIEMSNLGYTDPTPETVTLNVDVPFAAGKHQMQKAGNFAKGDLIFSKSHKIRPVDIGLLAEIGAAKVTVMAQPTVAVLPTGDELVDCSELPASSQIRNSNGPMIGAIAKGLGAMVTDLGIGVDERADLEAKVSQGLQHDFLILSGGVSAGTKDLVPEVLTSQGVTTVFHKVKVKPGKPIFFGVAERSDDHRCYVFGLPGNPVSSLVGMHLFVSTAMRILTGRTQNCCRPQRWGAILSSDHKTRGDRPTYWPGRRCDFADPRMVEPLRWNGSSDLLSLREAEGFIYFPVRESGYEAGDGVEFLPF